ncbi:hypothetical protein MB27_25090 [Actinoplanes utahensis]|uniref:Uncharacterized protein n=1 Tax=Actinoplanes utahensis TaxID=1869 RepID=A0A0A6UHX3_ACTUT|nr:hypothetical protein MB27_25090 [Actinoplanes utahensis]
MYGGAAAHCSGRHRQDNVGGRSRQRPRRFCSQSRPRERLPFIAAEQTPPPSWQARVSRRHRKPAPSSAADDARWARNRVTRRHGEPCGSRAAAGGDRAGRQSRPPRRQRRRRGFANRVPSAGWGCRRLP